MTNLLIWLYLCCGIACGASFWKQTDSRRSIKVTGAIVVGILGPPLFPSFVFAHAIEFMQKARREASKVTSTDLKTPAAPDASTPAPRPRE